MAGKKKDATETAKKEEKISGRAGKENAALTLDQQNDQGFDPDAILISPDLSVLRDRSGDDYHDEIMNLAGTIFEEGQLHPGLGRMTPDGPMLIAGQRRLEAVRFLRSEAGQEALGLDEDEAKTAAGILFRMELRSDVDDDTAFRDAMLENVHRRRFTPIELARDIQVIRQRIKATDGVAGTKEVAEFLKIGTATVTEHERLLKLPEEIQAQVQSGEMKMAAALEFLKGVKPEKVGEVHELAQQKAEQRAEREEEAKQEKAAKSGKGKEEREHNPRPDVPLYNPAKHKPNIPRAKAKVEQKDVRAAAKELDAQKKLQAPKMAELKDLFELWTGPAYPDIVVKFAETGLNWSEGKVGDKALTAALDDICDLLPAGKEEKKTKPVTGYKPASNKPAKTAEKKATVKVAVNATSGKAAKVAKAASKKTPKEASSKSAGKIAKKKK